MLNFAIKLMPIPHKQTQKVLQKRLKRQQQVVTIKELAAFQFFNHKLEKLPLGEFDGSLITSNKFNLTKSATESESELVERMFDHMQTLADDAATHHVLANFDNGKYYLHPRKLKNKTAAHASIKISLMADRTNHVTRLTTNEFSFYPAKDRGPLSLVGFKKLLEKLNKVAKVYPANLHLLFATIPVQITQGQVNNIAVYLECGQNPVFHVFAKAVASQIDPQYPSTISKSFAEKLRIPPDALILNFSAITVPIGGNFICKTVGGAVFRVAVDICVDHSAKIAKMLVQQELRKSQDLGEWMVASSSHVVSSNIVGLSKDSALTNTIVQVDPQYSTNCSLQINNKNIDIERRWTFYDPVFGSHTMLDVYPLYTLGLHTNNLDALIKNNNEFAIKLKALSLHKDQHPRKIKFYDKEINKLIMQTLFATLKKFKGTEEFCEKLINALQDRHALIDLLIFLKKASSGPVVEEINIASRLLQSEQRRTDQIKKSLAIGKSHTKAETDVSKLQTSAAAKVSSPSLLYAVPFLVGQVYQFFKPAPQPAIKAAAMFKENPSSKPAAQEYKRSAPGFNIFLEPLSWMEKVEVAKYLSQYSPVTLPWNKKKKLTTENNELLKEYLRKLSELEKVFAAKKLKRAYLHGVNDDKYADVELLIRNAKEEIPAMIKNQIKTDRSFSTLKINMERIEIMIGELTNKKIEKALKRVEIQEQRLHRRTAR